MSPGPAEARTPAYERMFGERAQAGAALYERVETARARAELTSALTRRGERLNETFSASRRSAEQAYLAVYTRASAASPDDDLQAVKAATARYRSLGQATKDGYTVAGEPCVASPLGTMGIHAVNPQLVADPAIDPRRPEIVLYVPRKNGKVRLVGAEYFRVDADGDTATDDDRPALFGQPFDGPMEGHSPTMPVHYDLHVWIWKHNPSGLFAMFNPSVRC
jgi:hypothetical protein